MAKDSSTTFRTIAELAAAIETDKTTVYRWVNNGIVEHANYVGSTAVFTPEEFNAAVKVGKERKAAMAILRSKG